MELQNYLLQRGERSSNEAGEWHAIDWKIWEGREIGMDSSWCVYLPLWVPSRSPGGQMHFKSPMHKKVDRVCLPPSKSNMASDVALLQKFVQGFRGRFGVEIPVSHDALNCFCPTFEALMFGLIPNKTNTLFAISSNQDPSLCSSDHIITGTQFSFETVFLKCYCEVNWLGDESTSVIECYQVFMTQDVMNERQRKKLLLSQKRLHAT